MTSCIRADRLYHYFFAEPDDEEINRIFKEGLVPLSAQPDRADRLAEIEHHYPGHFEHLYNAWAEPVLKQPYPGSTGVFATPIDFRQVAGSILENAPRLQIPLARIDPDYAIITYEDPDRISLPLNSQNLQLIADSWPAERVTRSFGRDPERLFYYVPQIVTYQPQPVQISANDWQPSA